MISGQVLMWGAFGVCVLGMMALDLAVFHRRSHEVRLREALAWSGVWISLALLFNLGVYFWRGPTTALEFLTSYLIEWSLSVDNLFVFLMIFSFFRVPREYQHKVLFWGIIGAIVMRAVCIGAGIAVMHRFHAIIYVFGAFLIVAGFKMAFHKESEIHPERNIVLRLFRSLVPITPGYVEDRLFVKREKRYYATPLFVALLFVETTDLIFAVDSIPAVLAITLDPFVVYTSNVFAILGLRALYFALAHVMQLFRYLHYGLSAILVFVGGKMLAADFYKVPVGIALGVVAGILGVSIIASLFHPTRQRSN